MCGISGFWPFERVGYDCYAVIADMSQSLKRRGPDSAGTLVDTQAGIALGHQRLAVVDLSAHGHQPMLSANKRYVLLYNGEIYNAAAIRTELQKQGIEFRGHSDSEVLVEACSLWGIATTLNKLIGMFAFALWDREEQKLFLARDRLGIKPLYYGWQGQTFLFGSELSSLTKHPRWQSQLNQQAIANLLAYNYINAPISIYENIFQLQAGYYLTLDAKQNIEQHQYWDLTNIIAKRQPYTEVKDALSDFETLLADAVECRMIADVPIGAFLSGGIDSSVIVAMMQKQSPRAVKTFSIGFDVEEYNEAHYAKAVANHLGTVHTELVVNEQDAQAVIPQLASIYSEPFADVSQIPTFLVSKLARQQVTVALSGDGGDELFGGYNRYVLGSKFYKLFKQIPAPLKFLSQRTIKSISPAAWDRFSKILLTKPKCFGDKIHKLANALGANTAEDLYQSLITQPHSTQGLVLDHGSTPVEFIEQQLDMIELMQIADTLTYLPGDILTKVDRASMAVSLESRVPFLDHRLVEFAWQLPLSMKINQGHSKWLLREHLSKSLPNELINRPKMGFGVPIDRWLRGPLKEWAADSLTDLAQDFGELLDIAAINKRWQQHQSGQQNWQYFLWSVLMLETWYQCHSLGV